MYHFDSTSEGHLPCPLPSSTSHDSTIWRNYGNRPHALCRRQIHGTSWAAPCP